MVAGNKKIYVITSKQENTTKKRKKQYLVLMLVRAVSVPIAVMLPLTTVQKIIIVVLAAVTQFIAVISANDPFSRGAEHKEKNYSGLLLTDRVSEDGKVSQSATRNSSSVG